MRIKMQAARAAFEGSGHGPALSFSDALNDVLWQAFGPESTWYCSHGNVAGVCGRCEGQ